MLMLLGKLLPLLLSLLYLTQFAEHVWNGAREIRLLISVFHSVWKSTIVLRWLIAVVAGTSESKLHSV